MIIKSDGSVWGTGRNNYGQLGLGDTSDRHSFTDTGVQAKQVECGNFHAMIIKSDGSVWGTGYNNYGQLGFGDTSDRHSFTDTNNIVKYDARWGNEYFVNYWLTPDHTLSNAPNNVYPLTRVYLNDQEMTIDSVTLNANDIDITYNDITFNPTIRTITTKFSQPCRTKLNNFQCTLQKLT